MAKQASLQEQRTDLDVRIQDIEVELRALVRGARNSATGRRTKTKGDQIVDALAAKPGIDVAGLAAVVYKKNTAESRGKISSLLQYLKKTNRVSETGGVWKAK